MQAPLVDHIIKHTEVPKVGVEAYILEVVVDILAIDKPQIIESSAENIFEASPPHLGFYLMEIFAVTTYHICLLVIHLFNT